MNTKFTFGDMIVPIELKEEKSTVPCTGCEATGTILLRDGRDHDCPVCNGSGKIRRVTGKKWCPVHPLFGGTMFKVSQIAMLDDIAEGEESYCLGNKYYDAENVFGSDEEANAECERRNAKIQVLGINLF